MRALWWPQENYRGHSSARHDKEDSRMFGSPEPGSTGCPCGIRIPIKAVPDAEEVISYQMPGYKLKGGYLLFFAVWKEHFSLYPASDVLVENFKDELSRYKRDNRYCS
jgi:hypothetical protein